MQMWPAVAICALLAPVSHAAYLQFQNCHEDRAIEALNSSSYPVVSQFIPESFRAWVNVSSHTVDSTFRLIASYSNGNYCDVALATDTTPVFTVVDFNGAHAYPGQILNASCVETWPEFSRLTLKLEASFNQSGLLDTYDTTLDLIADDGTSLLCVRAWLTPEVRPWIQLLSFWLPIIAFVLAVFVAFWPAREHEHHWVSRITRVPRVADIMAYIQFIYFSGALTLRYPGFFQPLVGPSSWSTLMLSMGPVTMDSPYAGVADGIYEINGTMTGEPGLEILTQITGSPVKPKSWLNTLVLALILFFLLHASIHVNSLISRRGSTNSAENSEDSSRDFWSLLKHRSWVIARVFLSYFLLPLSAWSTYQFADAGRLIPKDSTMAILIFMLLLLTIWWSWSRAQGPSDIGLLVLQPTSDETHSRRRYALVIFSLMLVRGVIIGGLQRYTTVQISILLACELAHLMTTVYWTGLPSLVSLSGILQGSRLVILSLHLGFHPGVAGHPERVFLGYVILSGHLAILIGIFLVPVALDIVRLILVALGCKGAVVDAEKASPSRSVSPSKSGRSAKFELSLLPPESPSDHHRYLAEKVLGRDTKKLTEDQPDSITLADLSAFMKDIQGEDCDSSAILSCLSSGLVDFTNSFTEISPASHEIPISALVNFLLSRQNSATLETPLEYDLNRPINEYFICSSHNTYLLGRQVITRSTLQGYISALTRGCRCIEVDCWDGRDGQPIVKHGYSLTASISFRDVMDIINQYAFVQSDFPLWISLEVHCSVSQKAIMAQIMRETFGSSLITESLPGPSQPLPSPSQLRGKILIKTKIVQEAELPQDGQQPEPAVTGCQTDSSSVSKQAETRAVLADLAYGHGKTSDGSSTVASKSSSSLSQTSTFSNGPLEQLAVYGAGRRLPPLSQLDKQRNFIYSISEGYFKTQLKRQEKGDFFSFLNLQHMLRVYPDATRVDSSNFHPLQYWRHGVQMVALNYQTDDLSMRLNEAMFNGGTDNSGYVLKPERLRQSPELVVDQVKELHIMIDVIMTKDICWPKGYTRDATIYVEIEIMTADSDEDARLTKRRSRKVAIGHRDVMIDQSVDFSIKTSYPGLVFLQWSVKLSSDAKAFPRTLVVASGIAKLENLKKGYRLLSLKRSFQDEEDCGYLFCKLDKIFFDTDVQ